MRFSCDSCQTRYAVPDERVQNRVVTMRCQKCNAEITVRGPTQLGVSQTPAQQAGNQTLSAVQPITRQDEPPSAFPSEPLPSDHHEEEQASTRIASLNELGKMRQAFAQASTQSAPKNTNTAEPTPARPPSPPPVIGWYLLINGVQQGPLPAQQIEAQLKSGTLSPRTYAWQEGMADWARLFALDPFSSFIPAVVEPPVRTPPSVTSTFDDRIDPALLRSPTPITQPWDLPSRPEGYDDDLDPPFSTSEASSPLDVDTFGFTPPDLMGHVHTGKTELHEPDDMGGPDLSQETPHEATRMFMAKAGLTSRKQRQKTWAIAAGIALAVLFLLVALDLSGAVKIPALGLAYDLFSIDNPHQPTSPTPAAVEPSEEEKQRLRQDLLGEKKPEASAETEDKSDSKDKPGENGRNPSKPRKNDSESKMLADIFDDSQKSEVRIEALKFRTPEQDLPQGIDAGALQRVIGENQRSIKFCYERAIKRGQNISGRLDIELSIAGSGQVSEVNIKPAKLKGSDMGDCVTQAAKGWRFPRFAGDTVAVEFPLLLQAGL